MKFIKFLNKIGLGAIVIGSGFWLLNYFGNTMPELKQEHSNAFANLVLLGVIAIVIGAILKALKK